jgi:uncharacterized protein (DUF488 family)
MDVTVWTIGHSTRTADEFEQVLAAHGIRAVADVRRFPGSRRHPHFGRDALAATLPRAGVEYAWMPALGGRRRPRPDSRNLAWRNLAFRGYADYMETAEFAAALDELLVLARRLPTAVMCAELLWWRCHRRLVADALVHRGLTVVHIRDETHRDVHSATLEGFGS